MKTRHKFARRIGLQRLILKTRPRAGQGRIEGAFDCLCESHSKKSNRITGGGVRLNSGTEVLLVFENAKKYEAGGAGKIDSRQASPTTRRSFSSCR